MDSPGCEAGHPNYITMDWAKAYSAKTRPKVPSTATDILTAASPTACNRKMSISGRQAKSSFLADTSARPGENNRKKIWREKLFCLTLCYKIKGKRAADEDINAHHIKVDWETRQLYMKYRDKLGRPMAGPNGNLVAAAICRGITKGGEHSNPVISEFHRIL